MNRKKMIACGLSAAMAVSLLSGCGGSASSAAADSAASAGSAQSTAQADAQAAVYPRVVEDTENQALYAADEEGAAAQFGWYRWEFEIDPEIDTVGEVGDGIGVLYFRLFVPEAAEGESCPVVMNLGGLGSTNSIAKDKNNYAKRGSGYASAVNQEANPSYVLTFNVPYEACVNYEAELAYIYQHGEIVKWLEQEYGNIDESRIYATGYSQGAGWSYELAGVQPDLLAAILINSGTLVHTTWGNEAEVQAIADSDVNVYIWHGYSDPYIPVNEAYRAYNSLTALGKTNVIAEIQEGGHVKTDMTSEEEITDYMAWLYQQRKGETCTEEPQITEEGSYADYSWAGVQVFSDISGWATANDYAGWTEPAENATWDEVAAASVFAEGEGGTGSYVLGKIRIGDETATSYDDATADEPVVTLQAGDIAAITVQGYTGGYGDDWEAFNREWTVDWAVLQGSVTDIALTCEASEEPVLRPETVTLANGGGPNVNNSLYNENTLDGQQVYVKISTAENFEGDTLKVALRFTRDLGSGEYASYYHIVSFNVA